MHGGRGMSRGFDAIIVGAGQAGPSLANRLTRAGRSVALVERKLFGGTCVNTGCMPTKTLVASARAAHVARRAADFGVVLEGGVGIDMAKVKSRADTVIANARHGVRTWLEGMDGCTVIEGHARFEAAHRLRVGDELLDAPQIFLNVGGRAAVPDMPGLRDVPYLTNTTILGLDRVPAHLLIVGGSYIGLEYAQMYRRFGARVTVVEKGPRLIGREDEDVSAAVRGILEGEGIDVRTGVADIAFSRRGEAVTATLDGDALACSHVLVAVGRVPNTDDLGLDRAGVATDVRAATSPSTTSCAPACRGSGRSATATGAARSRIPHTTTTRSSPRTCSMASGGGSASASAATRSTSTRRWAASASPRRAHGNAGGPTWSASGR
jgi:pyruvate/2-oxoglutarate dehydrogenase complex dihydrolipoamide dehydrogenase (E3) component